MRSNPANPSRSRKWGKALNGGNRKVLLGKSSEKSRRKVERTAYRCSPHLMKLLSDKQEGFVRKIGFGSLLSMAHFEMNKALTLWLIDKINLDTEALEFEGGVSIPVRPLVKCVLGIPSGPIRVVEDLEVDDALYSHYSCGKKGKSAKKVAEEMYSITEEEPFCIAFMMAMLALYLAPNTTVLVNRSLLGAARQVRRLEESVYAPVLNNMGNGNIVERGTCPGTARTTPNTTSLGSVEHVASETSARSAERTVFARSREQLQSAGPSSEPYSAQITEKMQLAPDATMGRSGGSPKDDRRPEKARVELPNSGQVKRAGEGIIRMDMSLLSCRVCSHPVKPPVFQCNVGHLACGRCLAELPDKQCQMCQHGGGFSRCPVMDDVVLSSKMKCSHDGCQSYVPYHELDDHESVCPHAPCFCMEPGCGFGGPPMALLGHLTAVHSAPVHKVHHGNVHRLRLSEARCLLHAEEDDSVFLLAVGALGMATVVSAVCIRAGASLEPRYVVKLWANGPPPPSSAAGSILLDMKAVTSSTRPGKVAVEELPSFLMVPPTYLVGSGASKEVSLDVRIDRM